MQHQAAQGKIRPGQISINSKVSIGPANEGQGFALAVTLDITIAELDQATAEKLVAEGHQTCPYSNATRGSICRHPDHARANVEAASNAG